MHQEYRVQAEIRYFLQRNVFRQIIAKYFLIEFNYFCQQASLRQPKYSYLVSKPSSNNNKTNSSLSSFNNYRDNSFNTDQRKQVTSYPASSSQYQLPSSSYSSTNYTRPEYGSNTYLDTISKSEYETYNPISYTGSKVDLNTYSPIDSPAKTQVMEDRVNTVLRSVQAKTPDCD